MALAASTSFFFSGSFIWRQQLFPQNLIMEIGLDAHCPFSAHFLQSGVASVLQSGAAWTSSCLGGDPSPT
eukprot:jgi/Pico_ML_1/55428/g1114.t1